jgi:hypothetical protein
MRQPIFYFEKLKPFDKWTIGLYMVLTLGLIYFFGTPDGNENRSQVIFGYAFLTQFCLYVFCYKSLRNLTVFFIWVAIGLFHLYLFSILKNDETLQMFRGHSATPLRNTVPLLLLFQVFRFLSAKIQGQELVGPSRGSTTDLFEERRVNWLDYTFFVIYAGCAIFFDM